MEQDRKTFQYTYSAKEQKEIETIRKKYLPPEEDKMEQLRKLDRSAAERGTTAALVLGIVGALILGLGMCCCMVWGGVLFIPGIVVGLAGMALVALAYPVYQKVTEKERQRIAPEILRLTEELMK